MTDIKKKRGQRGVGKKPALIPVKTSLEPERVDAIDKIALKKGVTRSDALRLAVDFYLGVW